MDSGAFTELKDHGCYRDPVEVYAGQVERWSRCGNMVVAVSQDYMCEPFILERTGLTVEDHQQLTIERYEELLALVPPSIYILPVVQGYWPEEYVSHLKQYGPLLREGAWVGVGSVCKRNARVEEIEGVLLTVKRKRPDLRLHGFGVKFTALASQTVRDCLYSADSMAWSYAARMEGRNANDWREAAAFVAQIEDQKVRRKDYQERLFHG